jgi:pimeloyl-ACP methyl ester carboxylesterase
VHSIGPNRLWVRLARSWAARGMVVLRLDLSGIGDSLPRPGSAENVVYSAEAAHDIASAIRYLQDQLGATDCRLLGLCSGAYHGFKAAVNGVPVTSAVLINPLTFFWEIGKPLNDGIDDNEVVTQSSNYRRQLFSLEPWRKLLSGRLDVRYLFSFAKRRLAFLLRPCADAMAHWLRIPLKEDLARELDAASSAAVQHFVFAVGEPGIELLKNQGYRSLEMLVSRKRITVDYVPDADHTFTRLDARDRLVKVLDHLMFGAGVVA